MAFPKTQGSRTLVNPLSRPAGGCQHKGVRLDRGGKTAMGYSNYNISMIVKEQY